MLLLPKVPDVESAPAELPSAAASPPEVGLGNVKDDDEDKNEKRASAPAEAPKRLLAFLVEAAAASPPLTGRLLSLVVVSPPSALTIVVSTTRSFDLTDLKITQIVRLVSRLFDKTCVPLRCFFLWRLGSGNR